MIKIREKDILFAFINIVMFFSWVSYILMKQATLIGFGYFHSEPEVYDGIAYILYSTSTTTITIVALFVFFIDIWWIYRLIRDIQKGYWKENL